MKGGKRDTGRGGRGERGLLMKEVERKQKEMMCNNKERNPSGNQSNRLPRISSNLYK